MLRCRNLPILLPPFQLYLCNSKRYAKSDFANSWEESNVLYVVKDTLLKGGTVLCIVAFINLLCCGNFQGKYTDKDDIYVPFSWEKPIEPDTEGFVDDSDKAEPKQLYRKK